MKIVKYDDSYAQKVADMWNESRESWGNDDSLKTAEQVIEQEKKSGYINLYLAVEDDKVVGYCGFSEYELDEDTSYLPLLNVSPSHHGKGVGKQLILKVLDDAIKSKFNRFDLFTWSGNMKAMPLYKKCGFFWEQKPDSVHLMNFIPYAYKTEAIGNYLERIDWYRDNKRVIDAKVDGIKEEDHTYYQYHWENQSSALKLEFEGKGRGLRLIDCDDYLIKVSVDKFKLVYGYEYTVKYEIANKTKKELNISINGKDNKNIKFDFTKELNVKDKEVLEGKFFVEKTKDKQNEWNTHPVVQSDIYINGELAVFKVGVNPIAPIDFKLNIPNQKNKLNEEYTGYIELENGFEKDVQLDFELKQGKVEFKPNNYSINLKSKGKVSIPVNYIVKENCIYNEEVKYTIDNVNEFNTDVTALFKGYNGMYFGEIDKDLYIVNGEYVVQYFFVYKQVVFYSGSIDHAKFNMGAPKLGKPFSLEFSNIAHSKVEYFIENDIISMHITTKSNDFSGVELVFVCELSSSGIFNSYYIVKNNNCSNLHLSRTIYSNLKKSYLPYKDSILQIVDNDGIWFDKYNSNSVTENWMYREDEYNCYGICWDKNDKVNLDSYFFSFVYNVDNSTYKSNPITISLNHKNVRDFRKFALSKHEVKEAKYINPIEFIVNDNNPFVKDEFDVKVVNHKNAIFTGTLNVNDGTKEIEGNEVKLTSKLDSDKIITVNLSDNKKFHSKDYCLFNICGKVGSFNEVIDNKEIFIVDNGVMRIKASADFSNSLYSLEFDGKELLDSSFPTPRPKNWVNPWIGGISINPSSIQPRTILQEKITCEFAEETDVLGNVWKGIKTTIIFEKYEKYKGMKIESFYLMLPGIKVLSMFARITQNSGKYINNLKLINTVDIDPKIDTKFVVKEAGNCIKYKCGSVSLSVDQKGLLTTEFGDNKIHCVVDGGIFASSEKGSTVLYTDDSISFNDKETRTIKPQFLIISDNNLNNNNIVDLQKVRFKDEDNR